MLAQTPSSSIFLYLLLATLSIVGGDSDSDPIPTPWPVQFHSTLLMNRSGNLSHVNLWYDWPKGRNLNIIEDHLGTLTYDLEWNNGTSFIYTLDDNKECKVLSVEVGILIPNWMDGGNYLGQEYRDGFLCNVWEKVEFTWYYEDVDTKRPVYWVFYNGACSHVMTFEVGKVLDDDVCQAPVYCFQKDDDDGGDDDDEEDEDMSLSESQATMFGKMEK